ncbi:unnamed protein product [Vitrella brassicaformis CCMP3155]|uniref:EF-hand domain-containing protein n=1 Tax=Vitrella brassicaformis (strain CCMP3155) TaxID=1169540 RepID=A0A0G4H6L4_VITBC|nr:unnamed protein product [Vitrella brassicaformis CCMP3155]|eukprot:CEM39492.1 unnamed protein product [Vitrella brassicaformis CCMP3155]
MASQLRLAAAISFPTLSAAFDALNHRRRKGILQTSTDRTHQRDTHPRRWAFLSCSVAYASSGGTESAVAKSAGGEAAKKGEELRAKLESALQALGPRRITGNYENRLKSCAAPEKVFEYFASIADKRTKDRFMNKDDFVNAIIPYNFFKPSETSASLEAVPGAGGMSVFDVADSNKDGRISFAEFLFFTTLLSTPANDFELAFRLFGKTANEGSSASTAKRREASVTYDEFVKLMTTMIKRSPRGGRYRSAALGSSGMKLPDGRGVSFNDSPEAVCKECLSGTLGDHLFGKTRDRPLPWHKFDELLFLLHEEVLFIEFNRCGDVQGRSKDASLSASEFARLFVGFVLPAQMENLAERIRTLTFRNERVTFADYLAFDKCVRKIDDFKTAVRLTEGDRGLTRECLASVLNILSRDVESDRDFGPLVDVVFRVFDVDGSGSLEFHEFFTLLKHRQSYFNFPEYGFGSKIEQLAGCVKTMYHIVAAKG